MRFSSLRSLGRLRAHHPKLDYSDSRVGVRLEEEIRKAYRYQGWILNAVDSDDTALLRKTLDEKARKTIDRVFRLLAMQHPPAELYAASRALSSPNARIRANAIEYLDNILKPPQKRWILGLVEDKPTSSRVAHSLREFGDQVDDWPSELERQADGDDDWLAACALYTIWATRTQPLYHLFENDDTVDRRPLTVETLVHWRDRLHSDASPGHRE